MSKQYDKQFKEDAVKYYLEHKDLGLLKCAQNLGISKTALGTWTKAARKNYGEVPVRGSGNYSSDEAKEIARLKRELRDTQDALEILKKKSAFWETDTGLFHRSFKSREETEEGTETPAECQQGAGNLRCFKKWLLCI